MKKSLALLAAGLLFLSSCTAPAQKTAQTAPPAVSLSETRPDAKPTSAETAVIPEDPGKPDIDLEALGSTLGYSVLNNILTAPQYYAGKTLRAKGELVIRKEVGTGKVFSLCRVGDSTACCFLELEFALADALQLPAAGATVTVTGTLFEENGAVILQTAELS